MEENIWRDGLGSKSDRFRWLEAYRRLEEFQLADAYQFVMDWPDGAEDLDIIYYRYVLSFLLYAKYQEVSFRIVQQHLTQCTQLAQKSYGKYTNRTRDLLGRWDDEASDLMTLCSWPFYEMGKDQDEREQRNREYRHQACEFIVNELSFFPMVQSYIA